MEETNKLNLIFNHIEKIAKTSSVFGKPTPVGEMTLLPLSEISFGAFAGVGCGQDEGGSDGQCGASGTGAKISPRAVLVLKKDRVTVATAGDDSFYQVILQTRLERF